MNKILRLKAITLFLFTAALLFSVNSYGANKKGNPEIKPVAPSVVCMINDAVMNRPQIPVEVDGKTYYGCCENCKERLKTDESARFGADPLTGAKVDKATAFIMEAANGDALYFESRSTAQKYFETNR